MSCLQKIVPIGARSASKGRFLPCLRCGLLLIVWFLSCSAAFAQDEENDEERVPEVPPDGMQYFRHKLHEAGLEPLRNAGMVFDRPNRTVIVLVGDRSVRQFLTWEMRAAVEAGAAILIATDRSTAGTNLESFFAVRITGDQVTANPEDCYAGRSGQGKPFHPFVDPYRAFGRRDGDEPTRMFENLGLSGDEALATNHPSVLQFSRNANFKPLALAGYPKSARTGNRQLTPYQDLFAAGGFYVRGRYLVLADHSIFLNQMLLATDESGSRLLNSNLSFTIDCIDWISNSRERDRCLFVEDGEIKTDFELKFPEGKETDLEKILKIMMFIEANGNGNRIIAKAQDGDMFNSFLESYISRREINRIVIIALVSLSALFLFWLTIRNRTSADPARSLVTPELAAMIPKGDLLRQRFDSLSEIENVYEAARHLVRDFLSGMGAEPDEHGRPPKLVIEDGYTEEDELRRKVGRLWRIAYDTEPVRVAPEQWGKIKEDLKEVLADADDGWWKFEKRGPTNVAV